MSLFIGIISVVLVFGSILLVGLGVVLVVVGGFFVFGI